MHYIIGNKRNCVLFHKTDTKTFACNFFKKLGKQERNLVQSAVGINLGASISANRYTVGGTKNEIADDSKRRWRLKVLPQTTASWKDGANLLLHMLLQNFNIT